VIKHQNKLPREVAEFPSLEVVRTQLGNEEPAPPDPALSRKVRLDDLQSFLPTSATL